MKSILSALFALAIVAHCAIALPTKRDDLSADGLSSDVFKTKDSAEDAFWGPYLSSKEIRSADDDVSEDVFRGPYPSLKEARSLSADGRPSSKEPRSPSAGGLQAIKVFRSADDDLSADGPFRGPYPSLKEARTVDNDLTVDGPLLGFYKPNVVRIAV
ncbi:hypothetical protein EIP91_005172 [Steccherinum ochraceum]|uniref:Uncharacterized protein n=1 Tax=Steccherinum ochraceum TaxID=92696 RepID=A0A4R0R7I5_9APHY|nr:hypothetical protein EIP91_005172 [Steccherinum ochraceum]